jgi:hypothetical protein
MPWNRDPYGRLWLRIASGGLALTLEVEEKVSRPTYDRLRMTPGGFIARIWDTEDDEHKLAGEDGGIYWSTEAKACAAAIEAARRRIRDLERQLAAAERA